MHQRLLAYLVLGEAPLAHTSFSGDSINYFCLASTSYFHSAKSPHSLELQKTYIVDTWMLEKYSRDDVYIDYIRQWTRRTELMTYVPYSHSFSI